MSDINLNTIYDWTNVDWSLGLGGTSDGILAKTSFMKSNKKYYAKLSSYSEPYGFYKKEALIELINSRIGNILGLDVLRYN